MAKWHGHIPVCCLFWGVGVTFVIMRKKSTTLQRHSNNWERTRPNSLLLAEDIKASTEEKHENIPGQNLAHPEQKWKCYSAGHQGHYYCTSTDPSFWFESKQSEMAQRPVPMHPFISSHPINTHSTVYLMAFEILLVTHVTLYKHVAVKVSGPDMYVYMFASSKTVTPKYC